MSRRKREMVLAELRDLVFKLCVAGGATIGLLAGLDGAPERAPKCKRDDACVGESLVSVLERILTPVLIGALIGMLVGVLLAQLLRTRRA